MGYNKKRHYWKKKDIEYLIKNYSNKSNNRLAKKMKVSKGSIKQKANKLKLKKSYEYSIVCKKGINKNSENGMWKGNKAGLNAIHYWIKTRKLKPKFCEKCHKRKPYDLANKSGKYLRNVKDYEYLCRSCHMNNDNRILNLKQFKQKITNGELRSGFPRRPHKAK